MTPIEYFRSDVHRITLPNSEEFRKACKEIAGDSNIRIAISDKGDRDDFQFSPFVKRGNKEVNFDISFMSSLWCGCYIVTSAFVAVNSYLNSNEDYPSCNIDNLCSKYYSYSRELTQGYVEWPNDLPMPEDGTKIEDDGVINTTNMVFMGALNYILSHEIAHLYLQHQHPAKENEIEADSLAIKWITDSADYNKALEFTYFAGFAFMVLIDVNAHRDGVSHPSSFSRLLSYLESRNLDDNDPLWGTACIIYGFWIKSFYQIEDIESNYELGSTGLKQQFQSLYDNSINIQK